MRKIIYFHPLLWYGLGYCTWMLFPPFFTEKGHHLFTVAADLACSFFLIIGYLLGVILKRGAFGQYKLKIIDGDLNMLLLSFFSIIYYVRIKLFSEVGVYALLHPFSRESSLIDTIATQLSLPYILLLMTQFYTTRKRLYLALFIMEIVIFLVPQMARSYYVMIPLLYFLIMFFYGDFSARKIFKVSAPVLLIGLTIISMAGPYINGVRSYAQIGKFEQGLELEYYSEEKSLSYLVKRLNIHGEAHNFDPIIHTVVDLDALAFQSMLEKWLGFTSEYKLHPTAISTMAGMELGYGGLTSTDFPRSLVLANYQFPVLAILLFNTLLGLVIACIYGLIYSKNNRLFILFWLSFIYGPMFGSGGAPPSTFIFQFIFIILSFALVFSVFMLIKYLTRWLHQTLRIL